MFYRYLGVGILGLDLGRLARAALFLVSISTDYPLCGQQPGKRPVVLPTLTTAAAVHGLSSSESKRRYPVRLRAVSLVSFVGWHGFFVNDGSTGVYVETKGQVPLTDQIHTGSLLEIEGVSGPGEFSPIVDQAVFRMLGEGIVPPAGTSPSIDFRLALKTDNGLRSKAYYDRPIPTTRCCRFSWLRVNSKWKL